MAKSFASHTPDDLDQVAQWFVASYPQPVVVLFDAGMGAGKTTLIRALCKHLGAVDMSSPTFSLVNEYTGNARQKIFHFDLYRMEHTHQALDIGFEEYLAQNAYVFIEWPAVVRPLLQEWVEVSIDEKADHRVICFQNHN